MKTSNRFINMDEIKNHVCELVALDEDYDPIYTELPHPHGSIVFTMFNDRIVRGMIIGFEWEMYQEPVYKIELVNVYSEDKKFIKVQSCDIFSRIEDLAKNLIVSYVLNNHNDKPFSENPVFNMEGVA